MFWRKKRDEKFRRAYEEALRLFLNKEIKACRELLEPWSKKGYTEATALIGRTYRIFYGMAKDGQKKDEFRQGYLEYLERGAKQGDAEAQFRLGAAYEFSESLGLPTDMEKALYYYELSAEQEHGDGLNNLATLYEFGNGVERDAAKAEELFHRAVTAGNPRGYLSLALKYLWGRGVQPDLHLAEEYLRQARVMTEEKLYIAQGDKKTDKVASYKVLLKEIEGIGKSLEAEKRSLEYRTKTGDKKEKLFKELLERGQRGDGRAQFELGLHYSHEKDYPKARMWYGKALENGLAGAAVNLGNYFYDGTGVPKDFKQAFSYYEMAEQMTGNKTALRMLGQMYENGEYVQQDFVTAATWYEKAVTRGDTIAAGRLGAFYENGKGVKKDYEKAILYYKQGIAGGSRFSEACLGDMYAVGKGVDKDLSKAIELFTAAEEKGSTYAKRRLEEIYEEQRQQRER